MGHTDHILMDGSYGPIFPEKVLIFESSASPILEKVLTYGYLSQYISGKRSLCVGISVTIFLERVLRYR